MFECGGMVLGARNLGVTSISMGKILSHCLRAPIHL